MYQPFLVAPFSSGISTYLKPWLQPDEAFTNLEDCFTYRGVVQKRYGYNKYGIFPEKVGIKHVGIGNGVITAFTPTLDFVPVGKRSLTITHTQGGTVITDGTDDGAGAIAGTNIAAGSTINYATGAIVLNFTAAPDINTPIRIDYGVRIAVGNGTVGPYAFTLPGTLPIILKSIYIENTFSVQNTSASGDVSTDAITGTFVPGTAGMTGSITYATGVGSVTFGAVVPAAAANQDIWATWQFQPTSEPIKGIKYFWASDGSQNTVVFDNTQMAQLDPTNFKITNVSGADIWTTSTDAFFHTSNYLGKLYILNNTDRLTVYDGTNIYQPIVSFNSATPTVNDLSTGLFTFVYKNRLIILRPTEASTVRPQRARYSALNNPGNFFSDIQGAGGFIDAPTPEWIIGAEFVRDELIVYFQESTWRLRYTGVDLVPYRWEKINDTRRNDSPYGVISYQNFSTSLGSTGLIRCDGVQVERYDDKIIDYVITNMDQSRFGIVNGFRFDEQNQQFLCHSSNVNESTDFSDRWLVWNFLENSFSVWNINATCFGSYFQGSDLTWADFNAANNKDWTWDDLNNDQSWLSFYSQGSSKIPLFGDENGNIFEVYPSFANDNGVQSGFTMLSTDFNPYVKEGQQARLGYIDFYFDRPTDEGVPDTNYNLTIDFFINDENTPYQSIILNPSDDMWKKKRVFSGAVANFHRFKIYLSSDQITNSTVASKGFKLNGFILYFAKAGRITDI
jgi:hypothetical protein